MDSAAASLVCLGDRNRLRILRLLLERPLAVGELVRATGLGQSLVSHHLAVLGRGGWVVARREGRSRVYRTVDVATGGRLAELAAWVRREIPIVGQGSMPAADPRPGANGAVTESPMEDYLL